MINNIITGLEDNQDVFESLLAGTDDDLIQWREAEGKWNLLEIACHLHDEEREDFRARLQMVLEDPQREFKSIDPAGWVKSRAYASQSFDVMVEKFLDERRSSISWLYSLENPPLDNTYNHPSIGPMSGKMILSNWLAHDYLHIRQITRIKYNFLKHISGESLGYAGDW
jgi:hypothetical protein